MGSNSCNGGVRPEGLGRLCCTQRAKVEYFSPVLRLCSTFLFTELQAEATR